MTTMMSPEVCIDTLRKAVRCRVLGMSTDNMCNGKTCEECNLHIPEGTLDLAVCTLVLHYPNDLRGYLLDVKTTREIQQNVIYKYKRAIKSAIDEARYNSKSSYSKDEVADSFIEYMRINPSLATAIEKCMEQDYERNEKWFINMEDRL